jgi:glycerol-3-phosphate acyltransferase PlsY
MNIALQILFLILSYLFGSIPFGFIIGKIKGVDIRDHGSKNIGSTNVGRVLGKKYAVLAYLLDMFKGAFFVFLFRFEIIPAEYCLFSPLLYGLATVFGHICSIFLRFKGGKAVATGSGVIFGFCPWLLPVLLIIFGIITISSRYVSLGSLISSGITLVFSLILFLYGSDPLLGKDINFDFPLFCFLLMLIIFFRHRENIVRLARHQENQIKRKN